MLGTDISIRDVRYDTQSYVYRTPIKFGGRVVTEATVLNVAIDVETPTGRRATGRGSMPLGNAWAWPSSQLSNDQTLAAILDLGKSITESAIGWSGHPLEIAHQMAPQRARLAAEVVSSCHLDEPMPPLAVLLASSPLEASLFDAHGRAQQTSSYRLLGREHLQCDLGDFLGGEFHGVQISDHVASVPRAELPMYHLVGALDPLDTENVVQPVGDGLPETLREWIARDGLTHLKIKLAGDQLSWDVQRVAGVDRVASNFDPDRAWQFSLDFNERCEGAEYVLELLDRLSREAPSSLARIQYIEQPTHRDLKKHPENRMHAVAKRIPVVIDESLVDFESLRISREQGYSGVALKACKGHGEALLMAAVASYWKLFLCVQDLTCIGASLLHSASLAAHLPTVAAIESNGRQYCPSGNLGWDNRYRGMFHPSHGRVPTKLLGGLGLGFEW
jgi:L-alanine-DL-glutamate epimerase-like enolase superfamily enzyme